MLNSAKNHPWWYPWVFQNHMSCRVQDPWQAALLEKAIKESSAQVEARLLEVAGGCWRFESRSFSWKKRALMISLAKHLGFDNNKWQKKPTKKSGLLQTTDDCHRTSRFVISFRNKKPRGFAHCCDKSLAATWGVDFSPFMARRVAGVRRLSEDERANWAKFRAPWRWNLRGPGGVDLGMSENGVYPQL